MDMQNQVETKENSGESQKFQTKMFHKIPKSAKEGLINSRKSMLTLFADKTIGESRELNKYWKIVDQIEAFENKLKSLNDPDLQGMTFKFREELKIVPAEKMEKKLDEILPEAFATVREAAGRVIGQRHYKVQLIGGIVLHQGRIAEMKTGEGKTLVSTLAVYLNALPAKNQVHLITVNDYLARRDASWMGKIYDYLGLSIGVIQNQSQFRFKLGAESDSVSKQRREEGRIDTLVDGERDNKTVLDVENLVPCSRIEAYSLENEMPVDIVYGVNSEFGFDYLRDNIAVLPSQVVQKFGHQVAIVDEVDSILIDEARTPLIISQPAGIASPNYKRFAKLVRMLTPIIDYIVDEKSKSATLTREGINSMEKLLGITGLFTDENNNNLVFHTDVALRAMTGFKREVDYVVRNNEVLIVDVSTGRIMDGRRYSEGLHQAIEAKEGVEVKEESLTAASITYQNYFKLYSKLAGMTGTAATESEELFKTYGLLVVTIPTNKPILRKDYIDKIYKNEIGKFKSVVADITTIHSTGQPILVGTASIEKNELLSSLLTQAGISHQLLNAKNHEQEARIISDAGKKNSVTIATNIAGRGVDIKLAGEAPENIDEIDTWHKSREEVRALGGLHVIGTERHESRRIDNQLRGRSGRQGDAGSSQFYIALNDEIVRKFGEERVKIYQSMPIPDDEAIQISFVSKAFEEAQKKIESYYYDSRKHVKEHDDVINKQRSVIYKKRMKVLNNIGFDHTIEIKKTLNREVTNIMQPLEKISLGAIKKDNSILKPFVEKLSRINPSDDYNLANLSKIVIDNNKKLEVIIPKVGLDIYNSLESKWAIYNDKLRHGMTRYLFIRAIDILWREHLVTLEHLGDSTRFAQQAQKQELTEYKKEGMSVFIELVKEIDSEICRTMFKISPELVDAELLA